MNNELAVLASELPVLQAKGTYKYLKEMVDYRMKLATQLVVNKKRHSA